MSASAQLDGFDVSEDQFPDKGWLPKNVTLSTLDSLAPLPDHLVGKYDVVHIGLLVMIIKNENPVPLLNNVMAMLSTLLSVPRLCPYRLADVLQQSRVATFSGMRWTLTARMHSFRIRADRALISMPYFPRVRPSSRREI